MQQLDAQTIKPGFRFKNNSMWLTVVLCDGTDKRNSPCSCGRTMPAPTSPSATCPKLKPGISTGRGGITFPILTRRSKITENGFPTCCKSIF